MAPCGLSPRSGRIQESARECTSKWNNTPRFLSLSKIINNKILFYFFKKNVLKKDIHCGNDTGRRRGRSWDPPWGCSDETPVAR